MRRPISNAIFGFLDYAAYPLGMLLVAPWILRNLGASQYGIWIVVASLANLGSIVASGFGDALIQKVAIQRAAGSREGVVSLVRVAMGVHATVGVLIAVLIVAAAPYLAGRIANDGGLSRTCFASIEMAAVLTVLRSIETVCVSTQRAYERYGAAVRISAGGRIISLLAATLLSWYSFDVATLMASNVVITAAALLLQMGDLQKLLQTRAIGPRFDRSISRDLLSFGFYTWLLAVTGVFFSQADRLIGGAAVGSADIVSYLLCAQVAQPIYGLTAAGLHFLFPYLASRALTQGRARFVRTVALAILANTLLVGTGALLLVVSGPWILHALLRGTGGHRPESLLMAVLAGPALLGLSITGSYALLALGRARALAVINLAGCIGLVATAGLLMPRIGIGAIIAGRLVFAAIALVVYIPLAYELRAGAIPAESRFIASPAVEEA